MTHALPKAVREYPWPSIQRDSELLAQRCAPGLRLRLLRRQMESYFTRYESRAA